jgi:hypothetical protein
MNAKKETRTMSLNFNTTDAPCDNEGDCDRTTTEGPQNAVTIFCILAVLLCCMFFVASVFRRPSEESEEIANVTGYNRRSIEDRKKRNEWISKALVVREWSSDGATVETETCDISSIPDAGSKRQRPATKEDDRVTCGMGSDDYESFSEEQAVCAICLSRFQDHQLVCKSNNRSCQHIFHKDCMIGWLTTKQNDDCPMCRQNYVLKPGEEK